MKTGSHRGDLPARHALVSLSHPNLVLSAVKRSREGIVLRVCEAAGTSVGEARVTLGLCGPAGRAGCLPRVHATDLVERRLQSLDGVRPDGFSFAIHGFGIRTFEVLVRG